MDLLSEQKATVLSLAAEKVGPLVPELWAIWCSGAEGGQLHAEARLTVLDGGIGYPVASLVGRSFTAWKQEGVEVADHTRLNDLLIALFDKPIPPVPTRLQRMVLEMELDQLERGLRGYMELHHKRIHSMSRRMRKLADEQGIDVSSLVTMVSQKSGVPTSLVNRIRSGGEKVITKHLGLVEKALKELEMP